MPSIKKHLQELKDNFYLSSLQEQEPEGVELPPQNEPPPGSSPPDEQGNFIDPQGFTRDMGGEFTPDDMYGGPAEAQKSAKELGRIYELNKIYFRLYTIHTLLTDISDPKLKKIKTMVSEAFEIYRLIINNILSYKPMIDDIILRYYAFISRVVLTLEKYYEITSEMNTDV